MATQEYQNQPRLYRSPEGDYPRAMYPYRERPRNLSADLLLVGVVGAGLGLLAWHYLGPDVRRYLKIRSM